MTHTSHASRCHAALALTLAAVTTLAVLVAPSAARAVPTTLTYAGVLTDNGARVEGPHDVLFEIFDDDIGGALLYDETQAALVIVDGELIAELGQNALDDTVLAQPEVWLQVTVDGTPLTPRVRLNSVPYALRAEAAQRAVEAALADDVLSFGGLLPEDVVTNTQLTQLGLANGLTAGAAISIAQGTVSVTDNGIGPGQLAQNAVTTNAIANLAVTTQKIANNAVTAGQIAGGAVGTAQIADDAVKTAQLADGAVGGLELATNAVSTGHIVDGSVIGTKIADGAVSTAKLVDGAVTSAKIADGTIATADILDDAVDAAKIRNAVTVFVVTSPGCLEDVGTVRIGQATCVASTVGCTAGQCTPCAASSGCATCAQQVCANSFVGFLVGQ